jgi:aryl-alcohol dehydrogenase-like predicted oxidoreductase
MIGKWFKRTGKRADIFLGTKVGIVTDGKWGLKGIDSSYENCKKQCEESLEKLGTHYIDLRKCFVIITGVR